MTYRGPTPRKLPLLPLQRKVSRTCSGSPARPGWLRPCPVRSPAAAGAQCSLGPGRSAGRPFQQAQCVWSPFPVPGSPPELVAGAGRADSSWCSSGAGMSWARRRIEPSARNAIQRFRVDRRSRCRAANSRCDKSEISVMSTSGRRDSGSACVGRAGESGWF